MLQVTLHEISRYSNCLVNLFIWGVKKYLWLNCDCKTRQNQYRSVSVETQWHKYLNSVLFCTQLKLYDILEHINQSKSLLLNFYGLLSKVWVLQTLTGFSRFVAVLSTQCVTLHWLTQPVLTHDSRYLNSLLLNISIHILFNILYTFLRVLFFCFIDFRVVNSLINATLWLNQSCLRYF